MQASEVELSQLFSQLPSEFAEEYFSLSEAERSLFLKAITEEGVLDALHGLDYKTQPVTPAEFFSSPYYFGPDMVWNDREKSGLYPTWYDELCYVLDPSNAVHEWVLAGSLGAGKTSAAMCAMMYWLYKLECLRNPRQYLGVSIADTIEFFMFNITLDASDETLVSRFERLINGSPFFRDNFPVNRRRKVKGRGARAGLDYKLEFPPYFAIAEGSQPSHFISRNIIGGILDEANFADSTKKSATRINYDSQSKAFKLYVGIRNRVISRFMDQGRVTGLLCLISSAASTASFLEQHKLRARHDPHAHISEFALYDVKYWKYSSQRMRVFVGSTHSSPRILGPDEQLGDHEQGQVVEVPVELRPEYERDMPTAIKEFSGVSTSPINLLIPIREQIAKSITRPKEAHPFRDPETKKHYVESIRIGHMGIQQITDFLDPNLLATWSGNKLVPRHFPNRPRFIHVDLAKNTCAASISMGCVSGVTKSTVQDNDTGTAIAVVPRIWLDFSLQLLPPPKPLSIPYAKIRFLIKYLRDHLHFIIEKVTFDGYQSEDSCQQLQVWGFEAKVFSIDLNPKAYFAVRGAVMEERFDRYEYPPLEAELSTIQRIDDGRKVIVDHPVGGSKDVSDSVAGVVWHCTEAAMSVPDYMPTDGRKSEEISPVYFTAKKNRFLL